MIPSFLKQSAKVAILAFPLITACSVFVEVPISETGQPIAVRTTAVILNPAIEQKADAILTIWCGNLTNIRRITLRFIRAIDPEWQSVCSKL